VHGPEHIDRPGDRPGDEELRRVEEYLDAPAGPFDAVPGPPAQGEQNVVSDRFDARTYSELAEASSE
jgi:hypothetical protein